MNYKKNAMKMKDIDLTKIGYDYGEDADDYECILAGIDREMTLADLLKDASAYLVYAHGVNWKGDDGYKVERTRSGCFERSYDATIYPVSGSKGGKHLACIEYSHDVPQGTRVQVIALTKAEAEFVGYAASFEQIREFAAKFEEETA